MADKDAAAKQRIIAHMNRDHHDSVIRYLQYFHKKSAWGAYDAYMTDIDLNGFEILSRGKPYHITITPPMTTYAQARDRVVELDKEARKALGHSDVVLNHYIPPTSGKYAVSFVVILLIAGAYSQRWWFTPGEVVEQYLGVGFASFSYRLQPWLNPTLFGVHVLEAVGLYFTRLKKYSVNPATSAFWLWMASTVIEGRAAYMRIDDYVKVKKQEQKH